MVDDVEETGSPSMHSPRSSELRPRYSPYLLLSLIQFLLIVVFPLSLHGYARTIADPDFARRLHRESLPLLLVVSAIGWLTWISAAVTTMNDLADCRGKSILAWLALVLVAIPCLPFLGIWYDFLVAMN